MTKLVAITIAISCVNTVPLVAQEPRHEGRPLTKALATLVATAVSRRMPGGEPIGLPNGEGDRLAAQPPSYTPRIGVATEVARQATQAQKKSFWKSPWPYVLIGAVVGVGIAIGTGGNDRVQSSSGGTGG